MANAVSTAAANVKNLEDKFATHELLEADYNSRKQLIVLVERTFTGTDSIYEKEYVVWTASNDLTGFDGGQYSFEEGIARKDYAARVAR